MDVTEVVGLVSVMLAAGVTLVLSGAVLVMKLKWG